ncbi:MAG: PKD domain-containing protein [Planctomycetes bacterium]|nr:PKD domain-containing protein [Planctomycetota bacterium]
MSVTLDASGSSDADGTIASYTWTGTPNPPDVVSPSVTLGEGVHEFTLVVTDDGGLDSAPDVVTIAVAVDLPITLFVDASNDSGIEDGAQLNPFDTIGEALALVAAGRGDSVVVMAGRYAESIVVPSATLMTAPEGAFNTAILGSASPARGLSATVTLHPASAIRGFSITGGTTTAVDVPTAGMVTIENCVLFQSDTGLRLASDAMAEVVNCTLAGNASFGLLAMPGAMIADLRNTILADNGTGIQSDSGAILGGAHNLFWNNGVDRVGPAALPTDLAGDPLFVSPLDANYHLKAASAARDAGDPNPLFNDLDGTQNDIGADGGPGGVEDTAAPLAIAAVDPSSGDAPLAVTFDASASTDEWGIQSYLWDVDSTDGIQLDLSGPNPPFTYAFPGSFIATLTVLDNSGLASVTTVQVEVGNNLPIASFTADPTAGQLPLQVNFTGAGSDPDGGTVSFEYDFGDGTTSNAQNPSHLYTEDLEPGAYTVELRVTDDEGATTAVQRSITLSANQVETQTEITPEDGGTLEITDPDSDLNGLLITVPPGAVSGDLALTAVTVLDPPSPPNGSFGIALDLGPSGTVFSTPITVTIPLPGDFAEDPPFIVLFYDEATGMWTQDGITNVQFIAGAPNDFLQFDVTHLTTFIGARAPAAGGSGGGGGGGGCFIATAAYGTPLYEDIEVLRQFRDGYLLNSMAGTAFVDTYYRISPLLADQIAQNPPLSRLVRIILTPTIGTLNIAKSLSLRHLLIAMALLATTLRLIAILRPKNKTNTA